MTAQLGRFTVRDINLWDAPELFFMFSDLRVVQYMGVSQFRSMDDARQLIERYQSSPTKWLAVCAGSEFLGIVGLEVQGHQATMTIAFNRTRKAGRGAGREFGRPFSQWVMTHPQIWRLWSYVHVDNILGQRTTERSGAVKEGRLRRFAFFPNVSTEPQDVYVYSIVR